MDDRKTTLERAFEMARSGKCKTVAEIRFNLKSEGYRHDFQIGPSLGKQLRGLMQKVAPDRT